MITLESGMDPHSLEIKRDGKHVGYVQWHGEAEKGAHTNKLVFSEAFSHLTLTELEQVLTQYRNHRHFQAGVDAMTRHQAQDTSPASENKT